MTSENMNTPAATPEPPAVGVPPLATGSAFCNDGLLTDEVVRDVWIKLNDQQRNDVRRIGDQLSKSERALYETLTAWLTLRGNLVVAVSSDAR